MMQCHRAPHRLGDGTLALWVLLDAGVRGLPGLHQERGCGCRAAQRAMHQCCTHAARTRPLHAHASHTPPAVQLSTLQQPGGEVLTGVQIDMSSPRKFWHVQRAASSVPPERAGGEEGGGGHCAAPPVGPAPPRAARAPQPSLTVVLNAQGRCAIIPAVLASLLEARQRRLVGLRSGGGGGGGAAPSSPAQHSASRCLPPPEAPPLTAELQHCEQGGWQGRWATPIALQAACCKPA